MSEKVTRRGVLGAIGAATVAVAAGPLVAAPKKPPQKRRSSDVSTRVYRDAMTGDTILSARLFVYEPGGPVTHRACDVTDEFDRLHDSKTCPGDPVPARFGVAYRITEDERVEDARDSWKAYLAKLRQHAIARVRALPAHLRTPMGTALLVEPLPIRPYIFRRVGWSESAATEADKRADHAGDYAKRLEAEQAIHATFNKFDEGDV